MCSSITMLLVPLALSYMFILSRAHKHVLNAYRESPWPGHPGQSPLPPYPPGGHHHPPPPPPVGHYHTAWGGPWPSPSAEKFGPVPSAHAPGASPLKCTSTSTPKATTTAPINRNKISVAECRDGDKVYRLGDKWTPSGGCGRYSCSSSGKTTMLGCPIPEPPKNCSVSALDPRQPWPFCCPRLVCD